MSTIRYFLDENVPHSVRDQLLRLAPDMNILVVGEAEAPPLGTTDPDILLWIERTGRILVTRNRRTMPGHLRDHLGAGHHVPGIFVIPARLSLGEVIRDLHLIWEEVEAEEFHDLMLYLPVLD